MGANTCPAFALSLAPVHQLSSIAGRRCTESRALVAVLKPVSRRGAWMCESQTTPISTLAEEPNENAKFGPVFVAGSNGRVGQRIVRALVQAGVPVRAGCRTESKLLATLGELDETARALVTPVAFDATSKDIAALDLALGDAQVVVSALGSTEGLNLLSFAQVDGYAVKRLMQTAAARPDVRQLVIVSSIGVGSPFLFPAAALNLIGGVLLWKDFSERAATRAARNAGKSYLIVRPGGMERQGDDFGDTHNVRLAPRNTLGAGVVSRLQVAQVVVCGILNPEIAQNKTVEVVAETTAPKADLVSLLEKASEDRFQM
eukprot:IDg14250t1